MALRTYDDYDNYGTMSSASDVDWWKVSFSYSGIANFWLGNIPYGCDYDLRVYASDRTTLLLSSTNGGNDSELISLNVTASSYYYIKVNAWSGYSTSNYYLLRAKSYPSASLSVPLYEQELSDTCGAANIRMMIAYYGVYESEDDVIDRAEEVTQLSGGYAYPLYQDDIINDALQENNISTRYTATNVHDYSASQYQDKILNNLLQGYPVEMIANANSSTTSYWPHTTGGHFLTVKGMSYNGTNYSATFNDSWPYDPDVYTVPISILQIFSNNSSGYIINVV